MLSNSMVTSVVFLSSLFSFALAGTLQHVKIGMHDFPAYTDRGVATANEFQFIYPENIKDMRKMMDSAYQIAVADPLVINNDDMVTINFQSASPSTKDWIAAYSPADVDIATTVPVKYAWCDASADYLTTGKGQLLFNFTNLRSDIAFYYYTNGQSKPVLVEKAAQTVTFKNLNQPLRPRMVPTGDYDVFNLLWSSASSVSPTMKWGTSSGKYTNVATATISSIQREELCGAPATTIGWRETGLIHTAEVKGMLALANTRIYYIFGDANTNDFSQEYVFQVPPAPGTQPDKRGTSVILFDDFGRGSTDMAFTWYEYGRPAIYTAMSIGAEVANGNIDAIYHGGDISYATGYLAVWDFYLNMLAPMASGTLYLTTVGNHESDWYNSASLFNNSDSGGECGVMTTRLLPMPAPATTNQPWWSYDVGLIHMVGMSTEHDFSIGSTQYQWLENDLKNVDRTKTPWIIFGGHRAMYLNSNYGGGVSSDIVVMNNLIANIEPLLYKYRVNVGFYGHNHVVQRHSAVYNKTVVQASREYNDPVTGETIHIQEDPQATVHFVIGTGGASFTVNYVTPYPEWNEMVFYQYGYAKVTAVNATYLDWQWILNTNNEVLDHVVITQSDPTKPWPSRS